MRVKQTMTHEYVSSVTHNEGLISLNGHQYLDLHPWWLSVSILTLICCVHSIWFHLSECNTMMYHWLKEWDFPAPSCPCQLIQTLSFPPTFLKSDFSKLTHWGNYLSSGIRMQKWIRSCYHCLQRLSMSWQVITTRADVAAKGKARLPFLFLVSDWEQKKMQTKESVGEQHKMHPEQRKASCIPLSLSIRVYPTTLQAQWTEGLL